MGADAEQSSRRWKWVAIASVFVAAGALSALVAVLVLPVRLTRVTDDRLIGTWQSDADRTIAMIAVPGDRSNDDIAAFGRLAGGTFDEIVIREDANPRGRRRGEVAELLVEAIASSDRNGRKVDVVLDEMEAAREAIARAERNDLVILLADKPAAVFEQLTGRTS